MTEQIKIGLTCLITFLITSMIVLKIFLTVGRRIKAEFKDMLIAALKAALTTSIALITFCCTVSEWFIYAQTSLNLYIYFLTCMTSVIMAIDNYKIYKRKEKKYYNKINKKEIMECPKCSHEMRIMDININGTLENPKLSNEMKVYVCKKCGYIEIYKR